MPRPDFVSHLVSMGDPYGFPSGQAQLTSTIWGIFFLCTKNKLIRFLSVFMIIAIFFSRMYLGVHTIYDVSVGTILGLTTACLYRYRPELFHLEKYESWLLSSILILISTLVVDDISLLGKSIGGICGIFIAYVFIKHTDCELLPMGKKRSCRMLCVINVVKCILCSK